MTDQEMVNRIKEIDIERDQLRAEKEKYEDYFRDKRKQERIEHNKTFIGKCFVTNNFSENENKHIKAFKILRLKKSPNEDYAECIALIDGYRHSCFSEYGICAMTLPLWLPNKIRMVSKESDPMMIDFYEEITQDTFDDLCKEYLENLEA